MEIAVCHSESRSKPLLSIHFYILVLIAKKSLVWFKALGFCYIIDTGPSLGLFLDILLRPYIVEILQLWVCRSISPPTPTPTMHQQITDWVDVVVDQHITQVLGLSGYSIHQSASSPCLFHYDELCSIAKASSSQAVRSKGVGPGLRFSCP